MKAHRNNIGFLRLVLASLVILGHAPELVDGNRARDPVFATFGVLSLGTVAVDGFFLISGFLIARSMIGSGSVRYYLERRVLRIYPAFIVAYLLCVYGLGPLVGAHPWGAGLRPWLGMLALREPPQFPGQLQGRPYPALNGSMWSIALEFRCYLLIAALWAVGVLQRKRAVLGLTLVAMALAVGATFAPGQEVLHFLSQFRLLRGIFGDLPATLNLTSIFLAGTCFYLFRDKVFSLLSGRVALFCAAATCALLYNGLHTAELGLTVFGGSCLFWLAYKAEFGPVQRINDSWDISYGVYLYGWPVATCLLWLSGGMSPWLLAALTFPLALGFGAASWWGVERWSRDLFRSRRSVRRASPAVLS